MISRFASAIPKFLNLKLVRYNSQYLQQAQISQSVGHYSNAISYYRMFLQNADCADSRQIYISHKFMADSFLKMNKVNQSHQHYIQALQQLENLPEKNSQEEVELLNKSAETCQDLSQALSYIEKSTSILNSVKNNNSLKMEALRVRAQILEKMGQKQESLRLCSQILLESDSLTSLDYKFAQKKRLILQSLETFQEVSKELDQIVISEHKQNTLDVPSSISDYYQISLKLWKKKEYFRSFQYVQRALQLAEVLRGSTHQDFYQCLDLIGQHLIMQGRLFEAQFYYERALTCVIQGKGPFHEDVIHYQKQLADLYVRQEKYQLAQDLYEQALQLEQKYYPLDHFSTLETNFKISLTELKQGKSLSEVKENLEWMLKQFKKKNGVVNDKLQSQIVIELAKINLELNNLEDSQRLFQEFLLLEDNVDLMLDAYLNLGYIEMLRKNFDKANQIFETSKLFVQDKSNPKLQKIAEQQTLVQQMQN